MKKFQAMLIAQTKQSKAILCALLFCTVTACEKQAPEKTISNEAPPVNAAHTKQSVAVLNAKIQQADLQISQCDGAQCPEITIDQLRSNYPELDKLIDNFTLQYTENLVQGFDLTSNPDADTNTTQAAGAQKTPINAINAQQHQESENSKQQLAQEATATNQLQQAVDKFILLSDEVKSLGSTSQLSLSITPKVLRQQGGMVTIVINANNYIGGAHGSTTQQYFNFELADHSLISLEQVIEKGQRRVFNELAYQTYLQWIAQTQPDSKPELYQKLWKFEVSENFYFADNGLILQYGEYEIGPYAAGLPQLVIPYQKLKGVIKAQYLPLSMQHTPPATADMQVQQEKKS